VHPVVVSTILAFGQALFNVPLPLYLSELQTLPDNVTVITQLGNGKATSLAQVFEDQESRRLLALRSTETQHLSLLPRQVVRQETAESAAPGATAAAAASPVPVAPVPSPIPVATLEGHYRPGEISAFVRLSPQGEFSECNGRQPNCERIDLERDGGPQWQLGRATVIAKKGYTVEGFDYSGPECGAFRLAYELLKPDKNGVQYIHFELRKTPTWPEPQAADCRMTVTQVPIPASTPASVPAAH